MKYISDRVISFSLIIGNADKRICFIPCMMGGSMYITDDEDEIKALEGSGMYGRVYRRDPNCTQGQDKPTGGKPQKAAKKAKEVPGVETWQEAIGEMRQHGLPDHAGRNSDGGCRPRHRVPEHQLKAAWDKPW